MQDDEKERFFSTFSSSSDGSGAGDSGNTDDASVVTHDWKIGSTTATLNHTRVMEESLIPPSIIPAHKE
eukprot:7677083-Ditylum_brightwellii.AAC.1